MCLCERKRTSRGTNTKIALPKSVSNELGNVFLSLMVLHTDYISEILFSKYQQIKDHPYPQ